MDKKRFIYLLKDLKLDELKEHEWESVYFLLRKWRKISKKEFVFIRKCVDLYYFIVETK